MIQLFLAVKMVLKWYNALQIYLPSFFKSTLKKLIGIE